ncbi:sigma-70 family RNA polymerase sigma factor [Luteolibacter yonseiensis]|uniref:Sigma-70 family RNA polymerase sigma factor n=1 Tax=Luteolibacter yonseiensis TaxID=1144680 RepID=A0A934VBJ3_9BACT|nr:sigma-70 family RNA polymerase sigma factor [Luteolibacter yonseiensis]MBK1815484.1 sigma-70 family RNA polymerase sigma factor [Luteolibacter yonseiensis]
MIRNPNARQGSFPTTAWSAIQLLKEDDQAARDEALASLCETYWQPVFHFLRGMGRSHEDAEDLAQGFFAMLLRKDALSRADPGKGRLRSYLLKCLKRFLNDHHDRETAAKRGGSPPPPEHGDGRHFWHSEGMEFLPPDREYDRNWALSTLDAALMQLGGNFRKRFPGLDEALFDALLPHLDSRSGPAASFESLAGRFGMSADTLRSHVHRLRKKLPEAVIIQVKTTLADPTPEEIREELAALREYL